MSHTTSIQKSYPSYPSYELEEDLIGEDSSLEESGDDFFGDPKGSGFRNVEEGKRKNPSASSANIEDPSSPFLEGYDLGDTQGLREEGYSSPQELISSLSQQVEKNSKISEETKQELKKQLETLRALKGEDVGETLNEISQKVELYGKYSELAVKLSQTSGVEKSPDQIEEIAKKHQLDLSMKPQALTKDHLEFFQEISSDVGDNFKNVKELAENRRTEDQKDADACRNINVTRTTSTTGPLEQGGTDVGMFQRRYDRKYYSSKDATSKALVEGMQASVQAITPLAEAMRLKIEKVEPEAGEGWKVDYNRAMVADKIKVNGKVLDLFNNTDGVLQVSPTPDVEKIEIEAVKYDNEGDGKWMAAGNGYGEEFKAESYDGPSSAGEDAITGAKVGAVIGGVAGTLFGPLGTAAGAAIGGAVGAGVGALGDAIGLW